MVVAVGGLSLWVNSRRKTSGENTMSENKDGKIYPKTQNQGAVEYNAGEGSMGEERNQGVVRSDLTPPAPMVLGMGQTKKLSEGTAGSHAI